MKIHKIDTSLTTYSRKLRVPWVGIPVLSLLVHSNVASLPPGSNTLNLMLWLPNKVIRLEGPCDSEAS